MARLFPIGISDFRSLRESGLHYVDKTQFIRGILDEKGASVFLFLRPRRFGKTLNLTMLRCFFEQRPEDFSSLFQGLAIWEAGPEVRQHFQHYPVIFLSFKDLKPDTLEDWQEGLAILLQDLFGEHRGLLKDGVVEPDEKERFLKLLNGEASDTLQREALRLLIRLLSRRSGRPVVVLIDEYDTPLHSAYLKGFHEKTLAFFRGFLGAGLKDNPAVFKAVITGILRVAKENIFSGINNLKVYGLLRVEFADCFGFTEGEVSALLEKTGLQAWEGPLKEWYNGYLFGDQVIYNPWSVMNFLDDQEHTLAALWLNTSSNDLILDLLMKHALEVEEDVQILLEGGCIEKFINDNVSLSDLSEDAGVLWSLLLFSGYLKGLRLPTRRGDEVLCRLPIPNLEVRAIYLSSFRQWLERQLPGRGRQLEQLYRAMFAGDAGDLERHLQQYALSMLSYHDTIRHAPEAVPHAFVLGICAGLEPFHKVRSNREPGQGRPDVLVIPTRPGQPGVALELKVAEKGVRSLEQALAEGRAQLTGQKYTVELEAAGAAPIHRYAIAFDGKDVRVEKVVPEDA